MNIQDALAVLVEGNNLDQAQTQDVFQLIMSGEATPAQIGAFLAAIRVKGETPEEIAGAAQVMRSLSTKVDVSHPNLVDTCGTGGSGTKLFNISTAAAFVTAAAGAKVAKHGNRKMTSFCGSADVLEAAGVNLELSPEQIATCVSDVGVGFMFAPAHHSAMRFAGPIRQEIGIRTMMNVLGPMTNPAGATRQVIGVFSADWQRTMAEVLNLLGSEHAMIVHSEGLDEIRLDAPSKVVELNAGVIEEYEVSPTDFEMQLASADTVRQLAADSTESSLSLVRSAISQPDTPEGDIVALNAGAAIYVSGVATTFANGVAMAQDAIPTGLAKERLEELIRISKMMGES
ncbi:MAG: anthranilate phosphoribosyltransferase [Pseudomonadales bacterium]|nr:anthranilate phosphoribosyltransferase [Pseudomonadales bacterium]